MNGDVREKALAEVAQLEAAAFRFGRQVRAFMAAFPEGLPAPSAVLPRFCDGSTDGGRTVPGGGSYVHMVGLGEEGVRAWALHLGTQVTRTVDVQPEYVNVTWRAEAPVDGLKVVAGSSRTWLPEDWEQLDRDSADVVGSDAA